MVHTKIANNVVAICARICTLIGEYNETGSSKSFVSEVVIRMKNFETK